MNKLFFAIIILKIMCYPGELNVVVGIIWNDLPGLFSGHPIIWAFFDRIEKKGNNIAKQRVAYAYSRKWHERGRNARQRLCTHYD